MGDFSTLVINSDSLSLLFIGYCYCYVGAFNYYYYFICEEALPLADKLENDSLILSLTLFWSIPNIRVLNIVGML